MLSNLFTSSRRWALAFLVHSSLALAAIGEPIALNPLVVVGGESAEPELHSAFTTEVARLSVELVDSEQVRAFLASQRNSSCVGDDGCLAALAKKTGASRSVLVSVSPYSAKIVLSGRVVSASGALLRQLSSKEYPKSKGRSLADSVQQVLGAFLAELDMDATELTPLARSADPEHSSPTPEPPSPRPAAASLRWVSYLAVGVGAAALAGAGATVAIAQGERDLLPGSTPTTT